MAIYQPAKDVILAAINAQNSIAVKATDIVYSAPKDIRDSDKGRATKRNSQIKVTADGVKGSTWSGKKNVYYNRLSFIDLAALIGGVLYIGPSNNTVADCIVALNLRYGFVFEADDLQDAEIKWNEDRTEGTVLLAAKPASVGWIDQYNFKVLKGDESLPSKVNATTLMGLKYPNGQMGSESVSGTIAQVYSYPFNFSDYDTDMLAFQVGPLSGDPLSKMANILKSVTGSNWVTTNAGAFGLSGSEVVSVGLNDPDTLPTNPKYKYVLALKLPATTTNIVGTMYLQFNDAEDPNEV